MEAPPPQTPQTPAVASLDHLENCQLEKLYNSISDGDLQMVKLCGICYVYELFKTVG